MKFRTIVNNPALLNLGRRIVFSLLAVWVHFAALFYVTIVLFSRGENGPQNLPDTLKRQEKIEVSLKQTPLPQNAAAKQDPQIAKTEEKETPPPVKTPDPTPQPAPPPSQPASSEGILNCASLTTKPSLITSGEGFMQIKDIDSMAGSITLREKVSHDGTVIEVIVEKSTMSKKMEEQVVNSAYHSLFSPGKMGDVPIDCTIRFEVSGDRRANAP